MASNPEIVEYDIILKAQEAMTALNELSQGASTFDAKVIKLSTTVDMFAKKNNKAWRDVLVEFQNLDRQMSTMGKGSLFSGEQGGWGATKNFMEAAEAGGRLSSVAETQVAPAMNKVEKGVAGATEKIGGFKRSIDVLRIALGTLIAMAVFQFFNFITEAVRKTIEGVKQLELALYQVGNAERALSEAGVNITPKDFDAMIKSLKELFPYLSKVDLTRMISQIALLTKDLGLTKDQLEGLVQAIPVMAQRGQVTIEQATQQVVNGLANNGRGWKDLGIVVDAAIIKQEAVNTKIVESADAYDKLTAEQQKQVDVLALLSILDKSVAGEQKNQTEYQKTLTETTQELAATWEDFLAKVGKFAAPVLISYLKIIISILEAWLGILDMFTPAIAAFTALWSAAVDTIVYKFTHIFASLKDMAKVFKESFKQSYESVVKSLSDITDTTTSPKIEVPVTVDTSKAKKELEDLNKDLLKLKEQENKIILEFQIKQERELQDHTKDMARDEQDYQIKRSRFIQEANQEINRRNQEYHQRELDEEAKFQEQLRQLREHYLYDLEDALRDRDAKQVLRLMEKYQMDKTDLINEHNLQKKADAQKHADDLAQAKQDEADKLKQMDEDHRLEMQRKEEDYKLKRQRELEDHQQELADLAKQREARLREAAQAIADELGIKGDGVQRIYEMLDKFYGPGGAFDSLYDYTNNSMLSKAEQMLAQVMALYAQASQAANQAIATTGASGTKEGRVDTTARNTKQGKSTGGTTGGRSGGGRPSTTKPQAQGGSILALGPTRTTYGENGPELATFIPLGRSGMAQKASSGQMEASGGKVQIELWLSPDLENRIMTNTLDSAADVIIRTTNSK